MSISAATNMGAMSAQRFLESNSSKTSRATEELASGSRIANSAYDPASAAIATRLSATIQTVAQASRNTSQAVSMLQLASGVLDSQSSVLQRMKVITAQSNTDTIGATERAMLDQEFQQLLSQVDTNASVASRWGGTALLNGGAGTLSNSGSVTGGATGIAAAPTNTFHGTTGSIFSTSASTGFNSGIVSNATVVSNAAGGYDVTVTMNNGTTYKALAQTPAASGTLTMVSQTDSTATIGLAYSTAAVTGISSASTFQTAIRQVLGVGTASPAVFTAGSANLNSGLSINASSATASGGYALVYTGAAASGTGTFRLSNGSQVWTTSVTTSASMTGTVNFSNGISLTLAAFDGTANQSQATFSVAQGSGVTVNFQVGELSSDTLSLTFGGANKSALNLSGLNVQSASNAQSASTAIDTAISTIANLQAQLGGVYSRLQFMGDTQKVSVQNQTAAKSTFADANIADAMQTQSRYKSLTNIASSAFTQALQDNAQWARMVSNAG